MCGKNKIDIVAMKSLEKRMINNYSLYSNFYLELADAYPYAARGYLRKL